MNSLVSPEAIALVTQFQALIGALIGFSGVVVTLLVNGDRSRAMQQKQADEKRRGLSAAFFGELVSVQSAIGSAIICQAELHLAKIRQENLSDSSFYRFNPIVKRVYESNAGQIGALGGKLSYAIARAYTEVAAFEKYAETSALLMSGDISGTATELEYGIELGRQAQDHLQAAIDLLKTEMPEL